MANYNRNFHGVALERKEDAVVSDSALKDGFDKFMRTFEEFKSANDDRLAEIEKKAGANASASPEVLAKIEAINAAIDLQKKEFNDEIVKINRNKTQDLDVKAKGDPDKLEYSKQFEDYMRKGYAQMDGSQDANNLRALELKAMSTQAGPQGGFTVRDTMEDAIDATLLEVSPIRRYATVQKISTETYKKLVNIHGAKYGWVGESESRPQTDNSELKGLAFNARELYAEPAATQTLLDDSYINIDSWLAGEVADVFAQAEGEAFVTGSGVADPHGFLAYDTVQNDSYEWGKVGYINSGAAGTFPSSDPADCIVDLYHSMKTGYRNNAQFYMNRLTLGECRKLKDGQGNYLIGRDLNFSKDGIVENMLGKPVIEIPDMPDIAAGSLSIAFADMRRTYLIVDRKNISVLRDPYTNKPYVLFYTTKRVGGGIQNFESIKLLRFAAS